MYVHIVIVYSTFELRMLCLIVTFLRRFPFLKKKDVIYMGRMIFLHKS